MAEEALILLEETGLVEVLVVVQAILAVVHLVLLDRDMLEAPEQLVDQITHLVAVAVQVQ